VTGTTADTLRAYALAGDAGAYVLTGAAADVPYSGAIVYAVLRVGAAAGHGAAIGVTAGRVALEATAGAAAVGVTTYLDED